MNTEPIKVSEFFHALYNAQRYGDVKDWMKERNLKGQYFTEEQFEMVKMFAREVEARIEEQT
jgi:hypothetical protein